MDAILSRRGAERALFGHDPVEALVVGLARHLGHALGGKGDAGGEDRARSAEFGDGAVVKSAAPPEPPAPGVEGDQRDDEDLRAKTGAAAVGLACAERAGDQRFARTPAVEAKRLARLGDRQGDVMAHGGQLAQQRPGVDLAFQRGIAGDDGMGRQIDAVDEGAGDARRRIVAERRSRRFRGGKAPLAQGGFGVDVGRAQMWGRLQE